MDKFVTKVENDTIQCDTNSSLTISKEVQRSTSIELICKKLLRLPFTGTESNQLICGSNTTVCNHSAYRHSPPTLATFDCDTKEKRMNSTGKSLPECEPTLNMINELHNLSGASLESFTRLIDDLIQNVKSHHLNQVTYSGILYETCDFLKSHHPPEVRHRVWRLYTQLIRINSEDLAQLRSFVFNLIRQRDDHDEDIPFRIELLIALTDNGKNLAYYEFEIVNLMLRLFSKLIEKQDGKWKIRKLSLNGQLEFLCFLINLIKFNAALIAQDSPQALTSMIQYACQLAFESDSHDELDLVYELLDVVLCRTHLPSNTVSNFVIVLCVGINDTSLFNISNRIMRNLIRTYLGFSCLSTLHHLIEDETNYQDRMLIRGAVFFLVHALWGDLANENTSLSPNTILPAFKSLIENEVITSPFILLEMANGIHMFLLSLENMKTKEYSNETTCEIVFEYTWELVLDICHALLHKVSIATVESKELTEMIRLIINLFNNFLDDLLPKLYVNSEQFAYKHYFLMNDVFLEKIFAIFEIDLNNVKKSSIKNLIYYRLTHIGHTRANWIQQLKHVMEKYFVYNTDNTIRLQCLNEMQNFLTSYHCFVDVDAFWEKVASPCLNYQSEMHTKELSLNFLIYIARKCNSAKNLNEIVEIFDSVANFPLKMFPRQHSVEVAQPNRVIHSVILHQYSAPSEPDSTLFDDMINAINGLIVVFAEKIHHTHCHPVAINSFRLLIKFSMSFYNNFVDDPNSSWIRTLTAVKLKIFFMILSLRSNTFGQLGVVKDLYNIRSPSYLQRSSHEEEAEFSPYILIRDLNSKNHSSPPTSPQNNILHRQKSATNIFPIFHQTFADALKLIINCIDLETDWSVLHLIFLELPKLLKHKGLIVPSYCFSNTTSPCSSMNHLNISDSIPDMFVKTLCKFVDSNTQGRLNQLYFTDAKLSKTDIYAHVYNSIMSLIGYKLYPTNQAAIILCLQNGLVNLSSKTSSLRQCIISLSLCLLEMQTTMIKFLQDIVISLSKISTNKALAVPKLEFLSNVILFPELYYNFTNKQYLSIFAIAESYINPYKYGEYTVALALRVISMWFLKCPAVNKQKLVSYLIRGLQTNILNEVEPSTPQLSRLPSMSLEHRFNHALPESSHQVPHTPISLSSTSAFNVCSSSTAGTKTTDNLILDPKDKEKSKMELVEVCLDMLASNLFTTSSPLPLRPSMIDKLLNKDKTQTWIIGHKLVQVTTTGCTSRAIRNGLCGKCFHICHLNEPIEKEPLSSKSSNITDRFCTFSQDSSESIFSSNRRRHRSEINSSNSLMKNSNFTNDDYFMNRNPTTSSSDSDLNGGNNDSKYCRCWCQSWAEILIRRSTGNSRFIMRVENSLGDFPYWNLTKEEDDSLSHIFKHLDPEISSAIKLQKSSNLVEDSTVIEDKISDFDFAKSEFSRDYDACSNLPSNQGEVFQKSKVVTRAASFGSRRTTFHSVCTKHMQESAQPELNRTRKLEKNHSFEESDSVDNSRSNLVSSVTTNSSSSSSETISTSNGNAAYRDRGYTISVMIPAQKSASSGSVGQQSMYNNSMSTSSLNLSQNRHGVSPGGLSPQYVFLQFYYNSMFKEEIDPISQSSTDKPILLSKNDPTIRSISCLDRITPYETHKIGVLYVGPGQVESRSEILANQIGSYRYTKFLTGLGQLISLQNIDPNVCYIGGLDSSTDGQFAISWGDQLVQVVFHVATFMPTLSNDPECNQKMTHIGNDFVCIMYNNSGKKFNLASIKGGFGQVHQAMVVITPLENESNIVEIHANNEFVEFFGHTESQMLSDHALPIYVRQLALHANLGAMVTNSNTGLKSYHTSNWVNRLRQIKRLRERATESESAAHHRSTTSLQSQQSQPHSRVRLGTGPSQTSKDDSDSVISAVSPSLSSAGYTNSTTTFDYENAGQHIRYSFPDFLNSIGIKL